MKIHQDPVCGMSLLSEKAKGSYVYKKNTYYFCNLSCLRQFRQTPNQYLDPSFKKLSSVKKRTGHYYCPMDPEIHNDKPESCPKCGMLLESINDDEETSQQNKDFLHRFWVSFSLTLPILFFSMGYPLISNIISSSNSYWIQFFLILPIIFWGAIPLLKKGKESIFNHRWNMFTLISLGILISFFYSVLAITLFPFLSERGWVFIREEVYFESAAVITTLVLLGQLLEHKTQSKTNSSLRNLMAYFPQSVLKVDSEEKEGKVPIGEIEKHAHLRIKPGERVPLDGHILEGKTFINESLMTGESMPVEKKEGDFVLGGTINGTGGFIMVVDKIKSESLLSQIIHWVQISQQSKAPIQHLADSVASFFTPAVLLISVISGFLWVFGGTEISIGKGVLVSVSVLLIACPCALGLVTPLSIRVGMGRAAEMGLLIRQSESLEKIEQINTLILDKTGTLTKGQPEITSINPIEGIDELFLLKMIASLESGSEHPLALAVVEAAQKKNISLSIARSLKSFPGEGVSGNVNDHDILIGNDRLMKKINLDVVHQKKQADQYRQSGHSVVYVAIDHSLAGFFVATDPIRKNAFDFVEQVKKEELNIIMATGDHKETAEFVAKKLGISDVYSHCSPQKKLQLIRNLQENGQQVVMVGDGINDAPALAQADVSIAMGKGTDVAKENSDIVLVKGNLLGVLKVFRLSRAVLKNIRQNLFFSFFYNIIGIAFATGLFYPVLEIFLNPMVASASMSLSSLSIILNALRLKSSRI